MADLAGRWNGLQESWKKHDWPLRTNREAATKNSGDA
jgi:hypothetical protein